MVGFKKAIRKDLATGMQEIYDACTSSNKSEKCLDFNNPCDIPCQCEKIINIRQQIQWIDEGSSEQ